MKHFILLIFLSLGSLLQVSCQKETVTDGVRVRVKNASSYQFKDVHIDTSGGTNDYGRLNAGKETEYAAYTQAYNYAYIKVTIDGRDLVLQPTDYVGETALESGKYTYRVGVSDLAAGRLSLALEKD
ncbi:hypothetical protein [Hymenobacter perfusus]|uniref:DUF4397 domain-containing protein n=1 Tax=Hymenobacter perfusus TaxID=1236770 RepID=A0A3R9P736_9BACT|nr:hypothetical protein [Hymenobacter perfusus]RSK45635.1 hypothetical protein EI293_00220 [Hymenobacter perfusus]